MKTGWQMEWDNEVRYFAPLRAEFNTHIADAIEPMRKLVQQFGIPLRQATKNLQQLGRALDRYNRLN